MIDNILKVLLLITSLLYTNSMSLINFEWIWFRICIGVLFFGSLYDNKKRSIVGKDYFAGLLLICGFNIYFHDFNAWVINQSLNVFLGIIGLKIIIEYCENYKSIYKYLIAGVILNCIFYIFQINGWDPIYHDENKYYAGGFFNSTPRLTTYIAIVSPLAIYYSWYLYFILIAFCFINDPQVWAICSCLLICFIHLNINKKILFILLILNFITWIYDFKNENEICNKIYYGFIKKIGIRLEVLKATIWYIFYYNFNGCGLGLLPEAYGKITAKKDLTVLSSILQFIMQSGIISIPYLIQLFRKFYNRFNINSPVCLSVLSIIYMSIFEYPFEIPRMPLIIISLIGFFIIELIKGELICECK